MPLKKEVQEQITERLRKEYAGAKSALNYENPYELLVATILAAQCTDARVNMITGDLFARFPNPEAMAQAEPEEIEDYIKTCGLFRNKAKNLSATARKLVSDFGGEVPHTLEELTTLPGVGRKTANVVLAFGFGIPAIPVDTHVKRVANRIGFADSEDPAEVEKQLQKRFAKDDWIESHHWLIWHGRKICKAIKPKCSECILESLCPAAGSLPVKKPARKPAKKKKDDR